MFLSSNLAKIPFCSRYFSPLAPVGAGTETGSAALQKAFQRGGVALVRHYLEPQSVQQLRAAYFSLLPKSLFRQGTDPAEGIFSGNYPTGLPPYGTRGHPAYDFVRSATFREFADGERLRRLAEEILGSDLTRLPRTPLRHFVRGQNRSSRAHVDQAYMGRSGNNAITLWVSLGDCPLLAGGPVYLQGLGTLDNSLLRENLPTDRPKDSRSLTHDLRALSDLTGRPWLWTNILAGDVLVHSTTIIHASLNAQIDFMRLSTDIRFVRSSEGVEPSWQNDWSADDGY